MTPLLARAYVIICNKRELCCRRSCSALAALRPMRFQGPASLCACGTASASPQPSLSSTQPLPGQCACGIPAQPLPARVNRSRNIYEVSDAILQGQRLLDFGPSDNSIPRSFYVKNAICGPASPQQMRLRHAAAGAEHCACGMCHRFGWGAKAHIVSFIKVA